MLQIIYHGHSCFTLTDGSYSVVLDPYDSHVPGYLPLSLRANEVLCSHEHMDHAYRDGVALVIGGERPFRLESIETDHDDQGGALRGKNLIRVFHWNDMRIIHLGDLGCALAAETLAALRGADALMIPVGGVYTIDAARAHAMTNFLAPRVVIPMHYRRGPLGFPALDTLERFAALRPDVVYYGRDCLELTRETARQTAILRCLA